VWTVAASAGIAALLVASEPAFAAVKLAGTAYLVLLGLQALRDALRPGGRGHAAPVAGPATGGRWRAYRQGLVSNVGNPKMGVFFVSLLPQFAGPDASFAALLGLGAAFCAMTLVWLSAYAAVVARAGDLLRRGPARRVLDAVTGTVLIGLGVRLATSER
jgi:threonine/homoserine/homoserine lactone efflux protein